MTLSLCVYCGSRDGLDPAHLAAAREVGRQIGLRGWRLVYGGGHTGLMGAVALTYLARLVEDRSECGQEIKSQAREGYELMCRIQDRQRRGIRIPRTWAERLSKLETFVMALRQCRNITEEWAEEFYRSLRWLRTLTA